jgi:hypothetical protein
MGATIMYELILLSWALVSVTIVYGVIRLARYLIAREEAGMTGFCFGLVAAVMLGNVMGALPLPLFG